jgi:hypothetical protein
MAALKGTCSINLRKQIEARNPSGSLYAPRACFKETQRALQVRAIKGVFKNQKPECTSSDTRRRWDVLMNRKFIVAVLLVVAAPVYAQAQNPRVSKGDAQKVGTIISGDKIKTQAYCDIQKLAEQVAEANEKKDSEKVNRLFDKIETLEKSLGPEYVALINGIQDIAENDELRAEFLSAFGALARLCTR